MGTIEKRGKGSWRIGIKVQTSAGWEWIRETIHVDPLLSEAKQRKIAEHELARLQIEIEDGEKEPDQNRLRYTVASWAETWVETEIKPNCSPVTYANYKYLIKSRIVPSIGDIELTKLTPISLTNWLTELRNANRKTTRIPDDQLTHKRSPSQMERKNGYDKPLSVKTLQNYYQCLDMMLKSAVRLEILEANPMDKVSRPKGRKKKAQFLSEDQALQMLRCLKDEPNLCYRCAVLLALCCGLRLGEVGALKLSDINWNEHTIDISRALKYTTYEGSFIDAPKSEASQRIISLPDGMMDILRSLADYQDECNKKAPGIWKNEGWIIHGWDGHQLNHDTPSKWFRKFADTHGFKGITFHQLRHTHATLLLANNIDVVEVAHRMGHSDPSVTLKTYAHALARRDQDAAKTINNLFGENMDS